MKHVAWMLVCMMVLLAAALPAQAQTRESTIAIEGEQEPIMETLYESSLGFSFWYANEYFGVTEGDAAASAGNQSVMIYLLDEDLDPDEIRATAIAFMEIRPIAVPAEDNWKAETGYTDAEIYGEYVDDEETLSLVYHHGINPEGLFATEAVVYTDDQGVVIDAFWPEEMNEGFGKYLQRLMRTITFGAAYPIRAAWVDEEYVIDEPAAITLTALEPVTFQLLAIEWEDMTADGKPGYTVTTTSDPETLDAGESMDVELEFIGEMPNNGIAYFDANGVPHLCALDMSGEDGSLYLWPLY